MAKKNELQELFRLFLRLGLTAFGGPAAHIALMQREVVEKRRWMDHDHFLDLIGATNLIPGPNSTEMAIHIGLERGGWRGLLVAGACFICPAVVVTGVIAALYQRYGQLPEVSAFIFGIKPAVIAVIFAAALPLAKKALIKKAPARTPPPALTPAEPQAPTPARTPTSAHTPTPSEPQASSPVQAPPQPPTPSPAKVPPAFLWLIAIAALITGLLGVNEIYVLFGSGLLALATVAARSGRRTLPGVFPFLLQVPAIVVSNTRIFFAFLKVGAILYGSGYVLFAFLDSELVAKGLLSRKVLIDAIAVGQFTPGPVFSSVTFIGWQMGGWQSAALATLAIFLPSFVFVALSHPLVPRMRKSKLFSAFLDGVNAASVAIILTVCIDFGRATITDWRAIIIAAVSAIVVFGFPKVNNAWVILGGALMGYLLQRF
jgi:chromate transporter